MHIWTFVIYPLPKIMLHLALGYYIRNSIEIVIHEFPHATTVLFYSNDDFQILKNGTVGFGWFITRFKTDNAQFLIANSSVFRWPIKLDVFYELWQDRLSLSLFLFAFDTKKNI